MRSKSKPHVNHIIGNGEKYMRGGGVGATTSTRTFDVVFALCVELEEVTIHMYYHSMMSVNMKYIVAWFVCLVCSAAG